jgi:hypothetical protein
MAAWSTDERHRRNPYLGPMLGTQARGATVKVMPRDRPTR